MSESDQNDLLTSLELTIKLFLTLFIISGLFVSLISGILYINGQKVDITITESGDLTIDIQNIYTGDPPTLSYSHNITDNNVKSDSDNTKSQSNENNVPEYPPQISKDWDRTIRDPEDPGDKSITTSEGIKIGSEHIERYVIYYVNNYRERNGLKQWKYSKSLASTARAHSEDMYKRNFFAHENPDGEKPWERFPSDEVCQTAYGENLVKTYISRETYDAYKNKETFNTEKEVGKAILHYWQESPPHNKLLMSEGYNAAGVGVYISELDKEGYVVYATLNVCTFNENEPPEGLQ